MCHRGMYGCSCGHYGSHSKQDRIAMLEESEKIMEAKLATIRHMKESLAKEKEEAD